MMLFDIQSLIILVPVILIVITIHEYAHAKVADMLGDPTPRQAGRLTLNPISHIDPIGFLMLILVRFGWAKPVPINPYNFQDPRMGSLYVSLAGPFSNFFAAWFAGLLLKFIPHTFWYGVPILLSVLTYFIFINLALGVFNLIPIPPLDGSHVLEALLPPSHYHVMHNLQRYGFIILIAIILLFQPVLFAIIQFLFRLVTYSF
ncbi:MAG: site-2 protease family protein [Candidatus Margulisbacteria bacterium]|nr:site-2 protease family protein [Candidatus Margulisiibacteriota bacterium]MBU1021463.1 site-2 protease family protein [Candidatus Margulisiibacteriota bacterium]MBU1728384.1 site-2 protease family protein [Candidatus Margulisiibacteriota bacterium]MBU1955873.1 site-2 protease family protein [Candidatus Margulisiibacteriota bacterium]